MPAAQLYVMESPVVLTIPNRIQGGRIVTDMMPVRVLALAAMSSFQRRRLFRRRTGGMA